MSVLRRRHVAEALGAQLAAQVEEIALEHGAIDRVFEEQRVEHARERALFGDELSHPRGDGVQAEVCPGFQVQQDALPIQFTKEEMRDASAEQRTSVAFDPRVLAEIIPEFTDSEPELRRQARLPRIRKRMRLFFRHVAGG